MANDPQPGTIESLRLMGVFAHPDDESLGNGGVYARYANEGVETYLLTATRGERGWLGAPEDNPGLEGLGRIREAELRAAAKALGIRELHFLDYIDGDLDQADPAEAVGRIVRHVRRIRPQVVITFGPDGAYGHPDHIAICQLTTSAVVAAADPAFADADGQPTHRVDKLYYMAPNDELVEAYKMAFGDLVMMVDNVARSAPGWREWEITTRVDTRAYWRQAWAAIEHHRSQLPTYAQLLELPEEMHETLWGKQTYYRALSLVNQGRALETDLFQGLRAGHAPPAPMEGDTNST